MISQEIIKHIINDVDLNRHPSTHLHHKALIPFGTNFRTVNYGDLHANMKTLLYVWSLNGLISLKPEHYAIFAAAYNKEQNASPHVVNVLMDQHETHSHIQVAQGSRAHLEGDEVCDRAIGGCHLVMAVTAAFIKGGGILTTSLSNHGVTFIQLMEFCLKHATRNNKLDEALFVKLFCDPNNCLLKGSQAQSLKPLRYALQTGQLSVKKLLEIYDIHKTSYQAFSYDYTVQGNILFHSHAAFGRLQLIFIIIDLQNDVFLTPEELVVAQKIIQQLPDKNIFNVYDYVDKPVISDEDACLLIDIINRVVQAQLNKNDLTALLYFQNGNKKGHKTELYEVLENREDPLDNTIRNIHGHDLIIHGPLRMTLENFLGRDNLTTAEIEYIIQASRLDPTIFGHDKLAYVNTWHSLELALAHSVQHGLYLSRGGSGGNASSLTSGISGVLAWIKKMM